MGDDEKKRSPRSPETSTAASDDERWN